MSQPSPQELSSPGLLVQPEGVPGSLPARVSPALADKPPVAPVPLPKRDSMGRPISLGDRPSPTPVQRALRDASLRGLYLSAAWAEIPRLLGAIDRNPFRSTYGCLDRQYWHYRTSSFASEMYQEGVLALAMVARLPLPGNPWQADPRVRQLAVAALRFSARWSRADGSCDDYYLFEQAMGAAVFSLQASARAAELLELDDPEILAWLRRRADWVAGHQESGRLTNHHALAALGLLRVAQLTGQSQYREAAQEAIGRVLRWQSSEGWFDEYGGADPGYQTVTIDCLAKIRLATGDARLDEPLRRAVDFARHFLHPDQSYGGEYGSRGTYHFYPHGMELLAAESPAAADLADGFLISLRNGVCAHFADDRLFAHRLANLLEAYLDWASQRAVASPGDGGRGPGDGGRGLSQFLWQDATKMGLSPSAGPTQNLGKPRLGTVPFGRPDTEFGTGPGSRYFPQAQILVVRDAGLQTVVSAARGGVFKHFGDGPAITDAGLILETNTGRLAASQWHDLGRQVTLTGQYPGPALPPLPPGEGRGEGNPPIARPFNCLAHPGLDFWGSRIVGDSPSPYPLPEGEGKCGPLSFSVTGPLYWCRTDLATPLPQSLLHLGMWLAGRWCRTLVRRLLQRRLITGRHPAPIRLTRTFTWLPLSHRERDGVRGPTKDQPFSADGVTEPPNDPGSCATGSASACVGSSFPGIEAGTGKASGTLRIEAGTGKASGTLGWALRVTDLIELGDPRLIVRRMAFGTDHQMAYVAASGVYQESVLRPWTDLAEKIAELNAERRVVVERQF